MLFAARAICRRNHGCSRYLFFLMFFVLSNRGSIHYSQPVLCPRFASAAFLTLNCPCCFLDSLQRRIDWWWSTPCASCMCRLSMCVDPQMTQTKYTQSDHVPRELLLSISYSCRLMLKGRERFHSRFLSAVSLVFRGSRLEVKALESGVHKERCSWLFREHTTEFEFPTYFRQPTTVWGLL